MFYPTLEPQVGDSHYQISEPYFRFILLVDTVEDPAEKDDLTRSAFHYVIATRDACKLNKVKMLEDILAKCPDVIDGITDEEMLVSLEYLRDSTFRRGELISTPELEWVAKYVRAEHSRKEAEKIIYSSMLLGSSHWDKPRHEYPWTISKEEQVELILEAIQDDNLGNKRKAELAEEIGAPAEELKRPYFRKLLWDRHYDKAAEVGMKNEDDVFSVVTRNLNAGYFYDALEILKRFLPERKDLATEIERIITPFRRLV